MTVGRRYTWCDMSSLIIQNGGQILWSSLKVTQLPDMFSATRLRVSFFHTEHFTATGDTKKGPLGLYRGQRGRTTLQLKVVGKSVHGSMPSLGLNPLEHGSAIVCEAAAQALDGKTFKTHPFLGSGTRTASWCSLVTPSDCAVRDSSFTLLLCVMLMRKKPPKNPKFL